jgi:hypothetical protein
LGRYIGNTVGRCDYFFTWGFTNAVDDADPKA